ncbi:hypothetical protein C8R47DRAFT_1201745 [Mycena vitilis]|nr:hypothetical protein C8R47DRAFT_1201745 [Mycena vitilis]
MQSARWMEDVFPAIRQPHMCWPVWGPAKTMDQFERVQDIWDIYAHGERTAVNSDGTETHMKPPLKLVEQFFKHKWRTSLIQQEKQRLKKAWERFREIPEWIDRQSTTRRVSPDVVIAELEDLRVRDDGGGVRGMNWLVQEVASRRKEDKEAATAPTPPSDPEESSGDGGGGGGGETKKRATAKDARRPGPRDFLLHPSCLYVDMGSPKIWEAIRDAAQTRSLLNLATIEGFQTNNRGLRSLVIGDDISIRIHAIVAALQAANVFNPGPAGERLVLEKFYYQLCQLLLACITMVFFFDGPGREPIKRGVRVTYRPTWLEHRMKEMILAFGFYYYDAPGEAEAELAQLNKAGAIDAIITEDSDAFLFGAQPSVQDKSSIYCADSIENTETVQLTRDGLLLCALLLGGDYHSGIPGAGISIACALAAHGFGAQLVHIMKSFRGSDRSRHLSRWRNELRQELRTNSSGHLSKRHPRLADTISDSFPDVRVVNLYLNPLTSRSTGFTGPLPSPQLWQPSEPSIPQLAAFASAYLGWNGADLLKKLNSTLWPGVAFKLMSSSNVLYQPATKRLVSPVTNAGIRKAFALRKYNAAYTDSSPLELYRVRLCTNNFIQLAGLQTLPQTAETDIKLVSIPKAILAVATRDVSSVSTNLTQVAIPPSSNSEDGSDGSEDSDDDDGVLCDNVVDLTKEDEEDLVKAHHGLASRGVIDLTVDI